MTKAKVNKKITIDNFSLEDIDNDVMFIPHRFNQNGGATSVPEEAVEPAAEPEEFGEKPVEAPINPDADMLPGPDEDIDKISEDEEDIGEPEEQVKHLETSSQHVGPEVSEEADSPESVDLKADSPESVDPEADSPESVDPEADSPESVDPEDDSLNNNTRVDTNEDELEEGEVITNEGDNVVVSEGDEEEQPESPEDNNADLDEDIPSEDIILDDDELVIDNDVVIEIKDEDIIPEEKIIANERDQSDDLFNEIMKTIPENFRNNRTIIKKIQTIVKSCSILKEDYSLPSNDPENIYKLNIKLKPSKNKPLIEKLLKLDFEGTHIIPIVDDRKELYNILDQSYIELLNSNLDEVDNGSFNKVDNVTRIVDVISMRNNYSKGKKRVNYSYSEEEARLHQLTKPYKLENNPNSLNMKLLNDRKVLRNTFSKEMITYNKLKLENKTLQSHIELKNDSVNIVGFARLPSTYKNQLNKISLSNLIYKPLSLFHQELNFQESLISEFIKLEIEEGDSLLLNFYTDEGNIIVNGTVTKLITEEDLIEIKPIDSDKLLTISITDPNVDIINTTLSSRTESTKDNKTLKIFMLNENEDTEINNDRLFKYFSNIVSSTNAVLDLISNKSKIDEFSFHIIHKILEDYQMTLDDFTFSQMNKFIEILKNNMNSIISQSDTKTRSYEKFIKTAREPPKPLINTVSNKSLKELERVYGEYPHFNKSIDNDQMRLSWIYSQADNGQFYFRNIVKNIVNKFKFKPEEIITKIEERRKKLEDDLFVIESNIDRMKKNLVYSSNKCPENRIVKSYNSYKALEKDNEREIEIDKDKRIYGEKDNFVKPDMFCILNVQGVKKLFKRIVLDGGKHIWSLETTVDVDHLVNENKDFCEYQQKKIQEIESSMFMNYNACTFNEIENSCIPKELDVEISKKYSIQSNISELNSNIDNLKNEQAREPIEESLKKLELYLDGYNKLKQRKFQNVERDLEEERRDFVNPEHEMLYKKIDLYLEKISKLENAERYQLLEILIKKYGRDYIETNEPKENPLNTYCKFGNKMICCECDRRFIQLYKPENKSNYEAIYDNIIDDLGVEEDGRYWCRNCGREINTSGFETVEGFNKNGARDVVHELLDDQEATAKESNCEMFEDLKMFLNAEDGGITTDNKLDIMKIYKSLLEVMGIKLKSDDELNVLKTVSGICSTNIKNKTEWSSSYKGKPKSIDKAYNNYVSINTIIYTSVYLFLILQSGVPGYKICKPHQKCMPSLDGMPYNEGDAGIMYIKCILESFIQISEDWKCIKKVKLEPTLKSSLVKLSADDYIKSRYKERTKFDEERVQLNKRDMLNVWSEFRPPLKPFNITNPQVDNMDTEEIKEQEGINRRNVTNYLSLKALSEIDKQIQKEGIENYMFSPSLLGNSCCLQKIDINFNYMNMFKSDSKFNSVYSRLNKLDALDILDKKSIYKTYTNTYTKLPTFKNDVFPSQDIVDEEICQLFECYVSSGEYKGEPRIYYNDICIYTNQRRDMILEQNYSYEEYLDLLNTIHSRNLQDNHKYRELNGFVSDPIQQETLNTNKSLESYLDDFEKGTTNFKDSKASTIDIETDINGEISSLKNIIKILSRNEITIKNKYLNTFIDILKNEAQVEKVVSLWDDLSQQIVVEIEEIKTLIEETIDSDTAKRVATNLENLGDLQNIFKDNVNRINIKTATQIHVNSKVVNIKKYIYSYLFTIPQKIKNETMNEELDSSTKPKNWNISQNYIQKLGDILNKHNETCNKFIIEKRTHNLGLIYESLCSLIKRNNNHFKSLVAKEHERSCDDKIRIYSKCTNRNLADLLHLVFILIFKEMLTFNIIKSEQLQKSSPLQTEILGQGEQEVNDINLEDNLEDEMILDDLSDVPITSSEGKTVDVTSERKIVYELLISISDDIERNRAFLDKHSNTAIYENIEKKLEADKEDNLAIMKDLDKESRQSLTGMIKIGLATWKNLSKNEGVKLHFMDTIDEVPNQLDDNLNLADDSEEVQANIHERARNELGDDFNQEQFDEWNENRLANERQDREARDDMDVMVDDDGDDYGDEAQGDDAYY